MISQLILLFILKQMLFIANKPTHLLITNENKIIFTTCHQLYLSNLYFIEQYLITNLAFNHPLALQYSSEKSETFVATPNSLELYWTDWSHQVQLQVLICLNNQKVYSIIWSNGWQSYGQFKQYSHKKIQLWRIRSIDEQFPSCYHGSIQYVMNKKHLMIYNHRKKQHQNIEWKEAADYLEQIHHKKSFMKAYSLRQNVQLLQVEDVLLYIAGGAVQHTLQFEGELIVSGKVATWINHEKMKILTFQQDAINNHGQMDVFDGHFYGSTITSDKITMLFYDFRQIKVRTVNFVTEEQNKAYELAKSKKNQFNNNLIFVSKKGYSANQMKKYQTVDYGHQTSNKLDFDTKSEKIHLQGQNLRNALKSSIGKFQEEFDKSHEQQKFDECMNPNSQPEQSQVQIPNEQNYYVLNRRRQSFGDSGGREINEQTSHYEQNIDTLIRHNTNHSIHSANSNISQIIQAETPGFPTFEADLGDKWNNFHNQWENSQIKKQTIDVINQQYQKQQIYNQSSSLDKDRINLTDRHSSSNESMQIEFVQSQNDNQSHNKQKQNSDDEGEVNFIKKTQSGCSHENAEINISNIYPPSSHDGKISNNHSSRRRVLRSNINLEEFASIENCNSLINKRSQFFCDIQQDNQLPKKNQKHLIQEVKLVNKIEPRKISEDFQNSSNKFQTSNEFDLSKVLKQVIVQDNKKYSHMLASIYRKRPEQFDEKLEQQMQNVIRQKEARLFFAEHIRNFNVQKTKDKLLRLYSTVIDNKQNRKFMTKALAEFKLNQVPGVCLCFEQAAIEIFRVIYPEVYIEDLLEPSERLYQDLLDKYFQKKFNGVKIILQGINVYLELPRNMLNIILFLNEQFKIQIESLFRIFTRKMLQKGYHQIILNIFESDIPQICGVDRRLFQQTAEIVVIALLEQNIADFSFVEEIISLMNIKLRRVYSDIIDLMESFSICGVIYDKKALLQLPYTKKSSVFIKEIISLNCAQVLAKLQFSSILKMINLINEGKVEHYYSHQSIEATKNIAIKLLSNGFARQAFSNLLPVYAILSRQFLAGILIKHFKGFFANRLVNTTISTQQQFTSIFHQILVSRRVPKHGDSMIQDVQNFSSMLSWTQFHEVSDEILPDSSWELKYIIYADSVLAHGLIQENVLTVQQLTNCFRELGYTYKSNYPFENISKQLESLRIRFREDSIVSYESGELAEVRRSKKNRKIKVIASLKGSEKDSPMHLSQYSNSLRQDPMKNGSCHYDLILSVDPTQTIKLLKEYYQNQSMEQFLQTVKLTDFQRIQIKSQNINKFKSIIQLRLQFCYRSLIPFQYFFNQNEAWNLTYYNISTNLTNENFWILYLIVDILFEGRSVEVVQLFIEKLIEKDRDDTFSTAVNDILKQIKLPTEYLKKAALSALQMGLLSMKSTLLNHVASK